MLLLQYLLAHVQQSGPLYNEATIFEERQENFSRAMEICEEGLRELPKYAALWFTRLRLLEKAGMAQQKQQDDTLTAIRTTVVRAAQSVSKELAWKVYFEAGQIEERFDNLSAARDAYVCSIQHCPQSMYWKIWLQGLLVVLFSSNS